MSDKSTNSDTAKQVAKTSLGEFVEANQKLLSVLGIFTALTVFSGNLPLKFVGYALAFVFLAISLLLWFEVFRRIPESKEWPLAVFHYLMSGAIPLVSLYWLLEFRPIWNQVLWIVLTAPIVVTMTTLLCWSLRRHPRAHVAFQAFSRHRVRAIILDWGLFVIIMYSSVILATLVSRPLNRALD